MVKLLIWQRSGGREIYYGLFNESVQDGKEQTWRNKMHHVQTHKWAHLTLLSIPRSAYPRTGIIKTSRRHRPWVRLVEPWRLRSCASQGHLATLGKLIVNTRQQRARRQENGRITQQISLFLMGRAAFDGANMYPKYWSLTPPREKMNSRSLVNFDAEEDRRAKRMISESAMWSVSPISRLMLMSLSVA